MCTLGEHVRVTYCPFKVKTHGGGCMKLIKWFAIIMLLAGGVDAANPVYTSWLNKNAVGGYDTVSFFSESGPVKGYKAIAFEYNGVTWLFATPANRDLFVADPVKYAPQYGGYCAWAVSQDKL